MDSITAKRSGRFYFIMIADLFVCLLLTGVSVFALLYAVHSGEAQIYIGTFFAFLLTTGMFSVLYKHVRNAPIIRIDRVKISFNKSVYYWNDLQNIVLTGKQELNSLWPVPPKTEGALIIFKNGSSEYLLDDMYANIGDIKLFIQQVVIDKNEFHKLSVALINKQEYAQEYFEVFRANPFKRYYLYGFLVIGASLFLTAITKEISIEILTSVDAIFLLLFFCLDIPEVKYLKVSQSFFVLKKLFGIEKIYLFSDVKEIVSECSTYSKGTKYRLRIITNDYKDALFYLDALNNKTKQKLTDKLESLGIPIRMETGKFR